jgi:peptide/nickel transport system substrate-binding protein
MSVRNLNVYRDPGTILIDQLREIYMDGELELTETATWVPKLIKKDYTVAVSVLGAAADDPDVVFLQNHTCASARNYTGHCDHDLDAKMEAQSRETDPVRRRQLVWEIDQALQEQLARPIIYHRRGGTCWQPWVKGLTLMVNSQYNGWRMEDVWLDRQP